MCRFACSQCYLCAGGHWGLGEGKCKHVQHFGLQCALGPGMDGRRAQEGEGGATQASVAL